MCPVEFPFSDKFKRKVSNKIEKALAKKALEFLTADSHCKPEIDMGEDTEARDKMIELYNEWEKLKKQKNY